jgi:PIN domain nuclease of toxin-antitoxin system
VKLLLDTVTFLWLVAEPARLSDPARAAIVDPANDVYLSAVSSWEIAVKHALGPLELTQAPERFWHVQQSMNDVVSHPS